MLSSYKFKIFESYETISHGVLKRLGGVSVGNYESLNLCYNVLDDIDAVKENLKLVKDFFGVSDVFAMRQVHGDNIKSIEGCESNFEVGEYDGLITNKKNILLMVRHADCQAAIFFDPKKNVLGVAHAGWKGLVKNIYKKMILQMHNVYNCSPQDILVGISPSLGPKNSEFKNYENIFPESFLPYQFKKNYFNLWQIGEDQLLESGILPKNIEVAKICTYNNQKEYFSYRRNHLCGRNATVAILRG